MKMKEHFKFQKGNNFAATVNQTLKMNAAIYFFAVKNQYTVYKSNFFRL